MSEHIVERGSDASLSAMYQDTLLAHHRAPHNRRVLAGETHAAERRNPLCGDAIRVAIVLDDGRIAACGFTGQGCSVAVASASMMTDELNGKTPVEALTMISALEAMLRGDAVRGALPEQLDALRGVAPFPGRHACATMPWLALRDALGSESSATPI